VTQRQRVLAYLRHVDQTAEIATLRATIKRLAFALETCREHLRAEAAYGERLPSGVIREHIDALLGPDVETITK
jgi:hypothetical protein